MGVKEKIIDIVFDFFVNSDDYNGIPLTSLAKRLDLNYLDIISLVQNLVLDNKLCIVASSNPHIIGFGHYKVNEQIKTLEIAKQNKVEIFATLPNGAQITNESHLVCAYPSPDYLEANRDVSIFVDKPYSMKLALGAGQLVPFFFNIEVLDRYFRDPRFKFRFQDYSGNISYEVDQEENSLVQKQDQIFIKTFGLGKDKFGDRVAVVYLRYLNDLTPELQLFWKSKENNNDCLMHKEYYNNTIRGEWSTARSVFAAFIEEQRVLNELAISIFKVELFKTTYKYEERPKEFTFFFIPTLENYNNFILLLDKIISDNINKAFFKKVGVETYEYLEISEGVRERKGIGTLRLFEEWLVSMYKTGIESDVRELFLPFKNIRQQRQTPAHRIYENVYDRSFNDKQEEIMTQAYESMKLLRLIFQKHPSAKNIDIDTWLNTDDVAYF